MELPEDISKPERLKLKIGEPKNTFAGVGYHIKMSSKGIIGWK
jgi:hypothetical protein